MAADTKRSSTDEILTEILRLTKSIFERRAAERPLPLDLDPDRVAEHIAEALPDRGVPARDVLKMIETQIIPTALNLANPMTFGLMTPHPLLLPAALDGLISALNQNLGCAWRTAPSAIEVELQTTRWLCQLCGLPESSGGHFTTGGTTSNLTAVRLALHRAYPEARRRGLVSLKSQPILYVSDQGHFSVDRAAGILGIGEQHVRKIQSRPDLTLDVDRLAVQTERDRREGLNPFLVVGTAGTTASGSIDPLEKLAQVCAEQNVWFHVDAAYAGALILSQRLSSHLKGIEQADSITLDPHKWMFIPFSLGAFLIRHAHLLRSSFGHDTGYLGRDHVPESRSAPSGFFEVSLDGSRRFNGLKLWATLKHLGVSGLASILEHQVELAQILYDRLAGIADIELAPRSPTNIVCFRFAAAGAEESTRDQLQAQFQQRLEDTIGCWLSNVTIQGKRFLRLNLLHYDLERKHIDQILSAVGRECEIWRRRAPRREATAD